MSYKFIYIFSSFEYLRYLTLLLYRYVSKLKYVLFFVSSANLILNAFSLAHLKGIVLL